MGVDLVIARLDRLHLFLADLGIVQRRRPVRPALEDGELLRLFGDFRDRLDGGGAGADDADALAGEIHRRVRPARRVIGRAAEALHARDGRHGVGGEDADGGEQEPRPCLLAALQRHGPLVRRVIPMRRRHRAAELHVAAQVELVGHMVQVFQRVGLGREMLLPVPFLHQLLGEGVAVGPAFRIEAGAGVTVPVPGAAHIGAGLEHARRHAKFAQAIQHEHAGNAGTDDDRVEVGAVGRPRPVHDRE